MSNGISKKWKLTEENKQFVIDNYNTMALNDFARHFDKAESITRKEIAKLKATGVLPSGRKQQAYVKKIEIPDKSERLRRLRIAADKLKQTT